MGQQLFFQAVGTLRACKGYGLCVRDTYHFCEKCQDVSLASDRDCSRGCVCPNLRGLFSLFFKFAMEDMEQEIGLDNGWIVLPPQMSLC